VTGLGVITKPLARQSGKRRWKERDQIRWGGISILAVTVGSGISYAKNTEAYQKLSAYYPIFYIFFLKEALESDQKRRKMVSQIFLNIMVGILEN
jgi:hypothetical protein